MPQAPKFIVDQLDTWTSVVQTKAAARRGRGNKLEQYGINKLRGLILDLAFRGLLVTQNSDCESASVLLKSIAAEKSKLVYEGTSKKQKVLPPIQNNEMPHTLPVGWAWVRFGDIAQHNAGKTLDKARNSGQLRDYLTTSNLYWGRFDLSEVRQMEIEEGELEKCTARQGDLLICEGGEAGRASVWNESREICFQNHIHRARFYSEINPFYAYRYFEKLSASGEIENYRKGVGISNMSGKALASIPFVLPPLAMQSRIVAKVDELMALCDELEQQQQTSIATHQTLVKTLLDALTAASERDGFAAAWARIADHFDTLFTTEWSIDQHKQSILQLAVMGKVVPQNLNDEPASELFKKVSSERATMLQSARSRKKIMRQNEGNVWPFVLPEGWVWVRTGDTGDIKLGRQRSPKDHYGPHMIPYLRVANVHDNRIDISDVKEMNFTPDEQAHFKVKYGDVLLNEGQSKELVVRPALYRDEVPGVCFQNTLLRYRAYDFVNPEYSLLYFRVCLYSGRFQKAVKQTTNMAHLSAGRLRPIEFPLPPICEQSRIVAKVDELMSLCDTLKSRLSNAQSTQLKIADAMASQPFDQESTDAA